ncbi:MarR family winged helix-turn-helix transcriptional regulator [Pseudorhodoplanes sp.]|uniref:MarR family winged helix-turn-helix transcriptional regulator n=1 Tax=Pseudorhodoplanes sp. TaxID=1934341 RepID=UPI00391D886C
MADCLCLAARQASRAITRRFDRALRAQGLRITQFSMLAILHLKGPQAISELANALGVERTTLTRNLGPVERDGLIVIRDDDDDARSRVVTLTAKGRRVLIGAFPLWQTAQADLIAAIGAQAADRLRSLARNRRYQAEQ